MKLEFFCAGIMLAAIGGCATKGPESTPGPSAKDDNMVCEREYLMGSNIPKVVCAPKTTESDRQRAIDDMRNTIRPGATKPAGG